MHPSTFYSTLFSQEKRDEVFVIMSFAPEFDDTWVRIFEPTIREDLKLKPNRVDYNLSGQSIIHDILDGIAHARLVLADITCSAMRDARGAVWPQRNGNVMWELGIAHVLRLPDEVIIIRADNEPSIFDLTQFRALPYDPDDVDGARGLLAHLGRDRLNSIDQSKSTYIQRCVQSMDYLSWQILQEADQSAGIGYQNNIPTNISVGKLLEMGALATSFLTATPELVDGATKISTLDFVKYKISAIGKAILECIDRQISLSSVGLAWVSKAKVPPT
jgi:hypothetical protein